MPNPSPGSLTFYPAYCHSVSPTFHSWTKLSIANVHTLQEREGFEGQRIYFHLNHPIKWIRLVGVVTSFEEISNRWILLLDDGSGATIEITCVRAITPKPSYIPTISNNPIASYSHGGVADAAGGVAMQMADNALTGTTLTGNTVSMQGIDIGNVVKVKGGIGEFRGERQVTLERISIVHTTNDEAAAWAELSSFRRAVLDRPWIVPPEEQKRLREEVDGTKRWEEEMVAKGRVKKGRAERKERKEGMRKEGPHGERSKKAGPRTNNEENRIVEEVGETGDVWAEEREERKELERKALRKKAPGRDRRLRPRAVAPAIAEGLRRPPVKVTEDFDTLGS